MASFFTFTPGTESRARVPDTDTAPLLGRFRAVPAERRKRDSFSARGLVRGFGSIFADDDGEGEENGRDEEEEGVGGLGKVVRRARRTVRELWIRPQQGAVRRYVGVWWRRWAVLVLLPAGITVAWCAFPFPQYPIPDEDIITHDGDNSRHNAPGHGDLRVLVNFWFFLFVYYGFYNVTALIWITKVFNIYSLNWWPQSVGFPITVSLIAIVSITVPIPMYYVPELRFLLVHNTAWIFWTFITMAMPVGVAFTILMSHERHLALRNSLSETQRIFTSSWWTQDPNHDTFARRDSRRPNINTTAFDPDAPLDIDQQSNVPGGLRLRALWIPVSFMRFMWFCLALFIGLLAYVLGEVYAEFYLRTLPHSNLETVVYVYSWVVTIHLLDGLTGWILGGQEGERVGSYPLGWIFKLYFMLTYQTYVRALYARLRSPLQFFYLQLLSSISLILFHPITMSSPFHRFLNIVNLNNQPYVEYAKFCGRSIFIRGIAENVSMLAFLGQILVLHYGANRDVYPYFAFDEAVGGDEGGRVPLGGGYDFKLTFWASSVTWACEITAGWVVRRVVWWVYGFNVTGEGVGDLGAWPELLPTSAAVMVHVLQNMVFGIVRLGFKWP